MTQHDPGRDRAAAEPHARPPRRRNPWWIPPFLGRVPDVEPRVLELLGLVTLALFFENYDISMLTSALPFISTELGMAEADLPVLLGTIRLGAVLAFVLIPFTDRIGRRRVFLLSVVGLGITTFLTAFAQTPGQFVAAQMVARPFLLTGAAVAITIVTEEFPAAHRGWALGMVGALSACGHGLGTLFFAFIEQVPYGWRALYAVGLAPLLLLPRFRRDLRETDRFLRHRAQAVGASRGWADPLLHLFRDYPGRLAGLSLAAVMLALADASAFQFTSWFTRTVHGWTPGQYTAMVLLGGGIGILGQVVAGRLGDRFGRRAVGAVFMIAFPLFVITFYQAPGRIIPVAWALFVFCDTASIVIIRALSTELFPTSHRGTAAGFVSLVQTIALAAGLFSLSLADPEPGFIARMTSALSLCAVGGGVALLFLPETRHRELEAISGD